MEEEILRSQFAGEIRSVIKNCPQVTIQDDGFVRDAKGDVAGLRLNVTVLGWPYTYYCAKNHGRFNAGVVGECGKLCHYGTPELLHLILGRYIFDTYVAPIKGLRDLNANELSWIQPTDDLGLRYHLEVEAWKDNLVWVKVTGPGPLVLRSDGQLDELQCLHHEIAGWTEEFVAWNLQAARAYNVMTDELAAMELAVEEAEDGNGIVVMAAKAHADIKIDEALDIQVDISFGTCATALPGGSADPDGFAELQQIIDYLRGLTVEKLLSRKRLLKEDNLPSGDLVSTLNLV